MRISFFVACWLALLLSDLAPLYGASTEFSMRATPLVEGCARAASLFRGATNAITFPFRLPFMWDNPHYSGPSNPFSAYVRARYALEKSLGLGPFKGEEKPSYGEYFADLVEAKAAHFQKHVLPTIHPDYRAVRTAAFVRRLMPYTQGTLHSLYWHTAEWRKSARKAREQAPNQAQLTKHLKGAESKDPFEKDVALFELSRLSQEREFRKKIPNSILSEARALPDVSSEPLTVKYDSTVSSVVREDIDSFLALASKSPSAVNLMSREIGRRGGALNADQAGELLSQFEKHITPILMREVEPEDLVQSRRVLSKASSLFSIDRSQGLHPGQRIAIRASDQTSSIVFQETPQGKVVEVFQAKTMDGHPETTRLIYDKEGKLVSKDRDSTSCNSCHTHSSGRIDFTGSRMFDARQAGFDAEMRARGFEPSRDKKEKRGLRAVPSESAEHQSAQSFVDNFLSF